eukprot:7296756-Prymnesium_polylepis.1
MSLRKAASAANLMEQEELPKMALRIEAEEALEMIVSYALVHSLVDLAETIVLASRQLDATPEMLDAPPAHRASLRRSRTMSVSGPIGAAAFEWSSQALINLTEEEITFTPPGASAPRVVAAGSTVTFPVPSLAVDGSG